ncbi:hypothetical protein RM780_19990 [Streptomyces sp. DSM 44917]|uniref:Uncharacterized protein n=1 Tax=Streptomyces boetiae TaxID=3075541 RepID=A0ABU2LCI6_9ACTN|nr:hypothetical protein [Streptomyces sp. DSM 44917]MDT0309225.1 hypothetical protein [Streptomyces sp. DSM 44917]
MSTLAAPAARAAPGPAVSGYRVISTQLDDPRGSPYETEILDTNRRGVALVSLARDLDASDLRYGLWRPGEPLRPLDSKGELGWYDEVRDLSDRNQVLGTLRTGAGSAAAIWKRGVRRILGIPHERVTGHYLNNQGDVAFSTAVRSGTRSGRAWACSARAGPRCCRCRGTTPAGGGARSPSGSTTADRFSSQRRGRTGRPDETSASAPHRAPGAK